MAREFGPAGLRELTAPRAESVCRGLALASGLCLFVHDAATIGVSYTLRISYALMALACVLGARFVVRGWMSAPPGIQLAAAFLVLVYVIAGVAGVNPVLAQQTRGTHLRWVVYILDLCLGLASVGLLLELFRSGPWARRLALAIALGGVLAASYGLYQWLAQRFGWPLANLDNAPNSEGITTGARFQGLGVFGWERIRGTFVEPFYFGIFLAAVLPLVTLIAPGPSARRRVVRWGACSIVIAALVLTDSTLAWASLLAGAALTGTLAAIKAARPILAGIAGGGIVLIAVLAALIAANPNVLSPLTSRSGSQLNFTVSVRTKAWTEAAETWSARPVLGYGPGASSVKLAHRPELLGLAAPPVVLGSAQGIWAASLIDAGVFGVLAWTVLFFAVFYYASSAVVRTKSTVAWTALFAAVVAVLASQVGADRLDLHVWVLVALLLAVTAWVQKRETEEIEPQALLR